METKEEIMSEENWTSKFFKPDEMRCKETGELKVKKELMERLDVLRNIANHPIKISSGYRSSLHSVERNKKPGSNSYHTKGMAADILIGVHNRYDLVNHIIEAGFNGIGINIKRGFIHVDIRPVNERTIFVY